MFRKFFLGLALALTFATAHAVASPPEPAGRYHSDRYYEKLAFDWVRLYLNRDPSPREVLLIGNQLRSGMSQQAVQANILGSDEYFRLSGRQTGAFVRRLYADVKGQQLGWVDAVPLIKRANSVGRARFALELLTTNQGVRVY